MLLPRFLLTLALMPSTACSRACPEPVRPIAPPPVTVVAKPPPCNLPTLPQSPVIAGIPVPGDADRVIVTKDSFAHLGRYLTGIGGWIRDAAICLDVEP